MSYYAHNRRTSYRYNADGKLVELTAENAVTGDQTTTWEYGTTLGDSGVASNELLRFKTYPDSTGGSDRVEYRYDRLGELTEQKNQDGTTHGYGYDGLGRLLADKVTAFGSGIAQAVKAIGRSYEARGFLEKVTSYADTGLSSVVNEVKFGYNGFGQVVSDAQAHGGAVGGGTPKVTYEYEDGTNNTVRRVKAVYPDGREIAYEYGGGGSSEQEKIDDLVGRVREIEDASDSDRVLARYTLRGAQSTVRIEYAQPGIEMTYIKLSGEPVGDAGDQYTGLDRFNRIEDIRWRTTAGAGSDIERYQYGFDRAGNRRWRRNAVAAAGAGGFDEGYQYDGLYQLTQLARGNLNLNRTGIAAVPGWQEDFTYDPLGNWVDYVTRVGGAVSLNQSRTHNAVNEITAIDGSATTVGYDGAGNMTVMPKVGAWGTAQQTQWDAWNRMVKITQGAGNDIGTYAYDGLTRRVTKVGQ